MTEEVPMPWDWPAEVNQLEAAAFCRWKAAQTGESVQLPTEAEWMILRNQVQGDQPDWKQRREISTSHGGHHLVRLIISNKVIFMMLWGMSGNGRLRRSVDLTAFVFILYMMIFRRQHSMVNIP